MHFRPVARDQIQKPARTQGMYLPTLAMKKPAPIEDTDVVTMSGRITAPDCSGL